MPKSINLNFIQNVKLFGAKIISTEITTLVIFYTVGSNDVIVKVINVQSIDTAVRVVQLWVNDGSTDFLIGSVNIPLRSGDNGMAVSVDLLGGTLMLSLLYDANGKWILILFVGYILKVNSQVTVMVDKIIIFVCMVEDY